MAHQRQLIRHYVIDLLLGQTAAGDRVEDTRTEPYRKAELPAISIYTIEDTVDQSQSMTAPREYTRDLKLEIAAWVAPGVGLRPGSGVADAMDAIALQIEALMDGDRYLGSIVNPDDGLAADVVFEGTTMALRGEGDAVMGLVTLTYNVTYRTLAPVAPTLANDFLTADAKYPLAGSTPTTAVPEDQITVRTP